MLKITPAEKAMLRPWFKPERQKKGNQVAARRSLIMRELQQAGCWNSNRLDWIPTRDMTRLLFDRHGVAARTGNPLSHVTVAKDYRQLYQRHFAQSPSVNFSPLAAPSLTHSLCTSNKKLTATRSPRGILQDSAGSRSKHRPRMSACARAPCDQADTHLLRTCLPNLSAEESWSDHGPETREGMQVSGQVATFRKPEIEQPTTEAIEIIDAEELAARLKLPKSRILEGTRSRSVDPIPHLKFGRYVRFQWGSRWLTQWLERRAGGRKPE